MSNLLIHEEPLLVLPGLASKIGLNEAIFLQQIHYWLNRSNNFYDGYRWVYNTYEEWREQFPFWSVATLRRIVNKLEKEQLLIIGNYNKLKIDKTKWYRINYGLLNRMSSPCAQNEQSRCSNCADEALNMSRPLPEITTETTTENTTLKRSSCNKYEICHMDAATYFYNLILSRNDKFKRPPLDSWAKDIRLMQERDKRSLEDIKKVMDWCQQDTFWMNNVLSISKLRKQFDQLYMKMNESGDKSAKAWGRNEGPNGTSGGYAQEEARRRIQPADNRGFAKTIG